MKGQLGVLGRAAAAGLCLICFSLAQTETFKTALPNDTEEIILEQGAWSREQWEEMAVNEEDREFPDAFILWGEKEEVQIVSRDLTRTANVSAIEACGDSRLLLRETVSLNEKDTEGCLLSADTAWKLFGSTRAVGEKIQYGERTLTIRGILRQMKGTLFVQAEKGGEAILNTVTLKAGGQSGSLEDPARSFMMRYGIQGKKVPVKYYNSWSVFLVFTLPLFMLLRVLAKYWKSIDRGGKRAEAVWGIVLMAGMGILFLYAFGFSFTLPKDLIPTRWSDFQFWNSLGEHKGEELLLLLRMRKRKPELMIAQPFFNCVKYMAGAWICYGAAFGRWRRVSGKAAVSGILLAWLLVFIVILLRKEEGSLLMQSRGVWFLLPFELTGRYLYSGTCSFAEEHVPE
ncbi:ABC transporter permease [Lactonifactor longoviformis]|uniref:ABC transporter permease n=1 Tax=Lactonifactor longoviformis TaxID=341220 RepID=UPI001D01BD15|nr:ABC transporter permease [Lactonifactor longoviformis]MCB5714914.1 ABC transporter permease [Lactonifactor longoviformis]MCB5718884.1 ABC transporter permease [Lactonifactor longoviformis]